MTSVKRAERAARTPAPVPRVTPEPAPRPTTGSAIWDLVIEDMRARDAMGRAKYGTPLQAHNGRDVLVDAYQEALDLVVYLRQAIEERDGAAGRAEGATQ